MQHPITRRTILSYTSAAALLTLPGCASVPGLSLTEAIRRLLTISSQNALAALTLPNGFYDSQVSRIALPAKLGGDSTAALLATLLTSGVFKSQLQRQLNRAAEKGAEAAAPIIADTVRSISITDALALVRGGPQAATGFLRGAMGESLVTTMLPQVGNGLRLFDDGIISRALSVATGIDLAGVASDVTRKADSAIWSAIGAEEAKIRANPRTTNDALLIGVFGTGVI